MDTPTKTNLPALSEPLKGKILPPLGKGEATIIRFTEKVVERLPAPHPSGKQQLYWDEKLPSFGVLVSGVTKTKSYFAQGKLNGKTVRKTVGRTDILTLDQARDRAKAILSDIYSNKHPDAAARARAREKTTLQEALDTYVEERADLRPRTREDYRNITERHLKAWLTKPLREITPAMVKERFYEIQRDIDLGKKNDGRSVKITGQTTANLVMRVFSIIWNFAADVVEEDGTDFPANPVRLRKRWFPDVRRKRYLAADQLPAFYKAVGELENHTARDYILFLLFTGLRRREAALLKWTDINFTTRVIQIREENAKTAQQLDLPMTTLTHSLLVARQTIGRDRSGYVFPTTGKYGYIQDPNSPLAIVAETTGIKLSAHDLRRTFATIAEETDISPWALKGLLNHSIGKKKDVTAGYIQMTADRLRVHAQRVADRITELCRMEPINAQVLEKKRQ